MGRHDAAQPGFDQPPERHRIAGLDFGIGPVVDRDLMVGIGADMAMPREMLADRVHAALPETLDQRARQIRNGLGVGMQRAVADHAAVAVIDIEHRRKAQIDAMRPQFRGQHKADFMRQMPRMLRIGIPRTAEFAHGGNRGEAIAETLHAAAFMIDGDDERRAAQRMNFGGQAVQLFRPGIIARKQDDTACQRMLQPPAVVGNEFGAGYVEHDRAKM